MITILGANGRWGEMLSHLLKGLPFGRLKLYGKEKVKLPNSLSKTNPECKVRCYGGNEYIGESIKGADIIVINDENTVEGNFHQKAPEINEYARNIAAYNPKAVIIVGVSEVNLALPLLSEALSKLGVLDPQRLLGATGGDSTHASSILAHHLKISPKRIFIPVVGGSSPETRVPLFSKTRPRIPLNMRIRQKLMAEMKIHVDNSKKVIATAQLVEAVLKGEMQTALTQTDIVPGAEFFSLPLLLGLEGVKKRIPLPRSLSTQEEGLIAHALKSLMRDVDRAKSFVDTNIPPGSPPSNGRFTELRTDDSSPPALENPMKSDPRHEPPKSSLNTINISTNDIPQLSVDTTNSELTLQKVTLLKENDLFKKNDESDKPREGNFAFSFCCGPLMDSKLMDNHFHTKLMVVSPSGSDTNRTNNLTDYTLSGDSKYIAPLPAVSKTNTHSDMNISQSNDSITKLKTECLKNINTNSEENNTAAVCKSDSSNIEKTKIPRVKETEKINKSTFQKKTFEFDEVESKFTVPPLNTESDFEEYPNCINNSSENCTLDLMCLEKKVKEQPSLTDDGFHDNSHKNKLCKTHLAKDDNYKNTKDVQSEKDMQEKICSSPVSLPLNQDKIITRFSGRSTMGGKWSKKHTENIKKYLPINETFRSVSSEALNKKIDKTKNIREKQKYKPQTDAIRELLEEKRSSKGSKTLQNKESPTANILKRSNFAKVKLEKLRISTSDSEILNKKILERQRRLIMSVKTQQYNSDESSKIIPRSNASVHYLKIKNSFITNSPTDHLGQVNKSLPKKLTNEKVIIPKKTQKDLNTESGVIPTSMQHMSKYAVTLQELKPQPEITQSTSMKDGSLKAGKTSSETENILRGPDEGKPNYFPLDGTHQPIKKFGQETGNKIFIHVSDTTHSLGEKIEDNKKQDLLLLPAPVDK